MRPSRRRFCDSGGKGKIEQMKPNKLDLKMTVAQERAELYFSAHPRSPAAVRRPKLSTRSGLWIAMLGRSIEEGVVGFGPSVEAALRAFDVRYLSSLRPPAETG
jgi:hypothetical protein